MTRTQPTDTQWASMQFACSTCRASRGQWCEAIRGDAPFMGNPARYLHVARWRAVREVIRLSGWEAWMADEHARAAALRQERNQLAGGLLAFQGELEQVVARWPGRLVAPGPLIDRITSILTTAKAANPKEPV